MTDLSLFEKATRLGVRFLTPNGAVDTEDLWSLPLTGRGMNLDDIAKILQKQVRFEEDETSFVNPTKKNDEELQVAFAVVKRIIEVKIAERDAAKLEADRRERKQKIMAIIEQKKDEKLSSSSLEELEAMLNAV